MSWLSLHQRKTVDCEAVRLVGLEPPSFFTVLFRTTILLASIKSSAGRCSISLPLHIVNLTSCFLEVPIPKPLSRWRIKRAITTTIISTATLRDPILSSSRMKPAILMITHNYILRTTRQGTNLQAMAHIRMTLRAVQRSSELVINTIQKISPLPCQQVHSKLIPA